MTLVRAGEPRDVPAVTRLIEDNLERGHLLPRTTEDLNAHIARFTVIVDEGELVACGELAPLSGRVAEVRSLVVLDGKRHTGCGRLVLAELARRGRANAFHTLCAFTHGPGYFLQLGFSIVPHAWLPEKIAIDCAGCPLFRRCGQHAVVLPLAAALGGHAMTRVA